MCNYLSSYNNDTLYPVSLADNKEIWYRQQCTSDYLFSYIMPSLDKSIPSQLDASAQTIWTLSSSSSSISILFLLREGEFLYFLFLSSKQRGIDFQASIVVLKILFFVCCSFHKKTSIMISVVERCPPLRA